jgi:alkyl hydroperoxide reductase subunit AhpC
MPLTIGDNAPDFEAETTQGSISFHEWLGNSWGILFSHPKDFTPVCTTELGYMAKLKPEFDRRGARILGLSVDPVDKHALWSKDIAETQGQAPNFPMIGDPTLAIAKLYGMLPATAGDTADGRTAADNQTVRTVFIIGPDKKIKLLIVYPMTTGRDFNEVLRVLDSLQLTAKYKVSTPVNWRRGDDVIIAGSVSNDEAKTIYPQGWKEPKPYIRIVPQPAASLRVNYRKEGIATFDATTEKIFQYMSTGGHPHAALKRYELVSATDELVTAAAEIYNPDGSTFTTTISHRLNYPNGIETTMTGGAFDGARFTLSYTPRGDSTQVDLEGTFPPMAGMSESEQLSMIDGFFTMIFAEDTATLRGWSPASELAAGVA